jgi:hypothetical protein
MWSPWIYGERITYPYDGCVSGNKKDSTSDTCNDTDEFHTLLLLGGIYKTASSIGTEKRCVAVHVQNVG